MDMETARLVLSILKDLEWSGRRMGAQPAVGLMPYEANACLRCSGLKPVFLRELATYFPHGQFDHANDCPVKLAIFRIEERIAVDDLEREQRQTAAREFHQASDRNAQAEPPHTRTAAEWDAFKRSEQRLYYDKTQGADLGGYPIAGADMGHRK